MATSNRYPPNSNPHQVQQAQLQGQQYQQSQAPVAPTTQTKGRPPSSQRKTRAFSFRSDKSHDAKEQKLDLHETSAEKDAKRLHTKADPTLAMNEAEPCKFNHVSCINMHDPPPLLCPACGELHIDLYQPRWPRTLSHRLLLCGMCSTRMSLEIQSVSSLVDALRGKSHHLGSILTSRVADPDRSNPTRSRWERPLDTIRSFEAAIDGAYSNRRSIHRSGMYQLFTGCDST